jgi:hypothetical protein
MAIRHTRHLHFPPFKAASAHLCFPASSISLCYASSLPFRMSRLTPRAASPSVATSPSVTSLPDSPKAGFAPASPPPPVPVAGQSTNPKLAAQQAATADAKNIVRRKLTGYVGFANLPNQWHRKSVRKGFNFNVMVVGEFLLAPFFGGFFRFFFPFSTPLLLEKSTAQAEG